VFRRAGLSGLPTREVVKPKLLRMRPSPESERIVVSFASGYRLCESCYEGGRSSVRRGAAVREKSAGHRPGRHVGDGDGAVMDSNPFLEEVSGLRSPRAQGQTPRELRHGYGVGALGLAG
jgi:hypothetical protein